jgi:putative ABC transport system permease protein
MISPRWLKILRDLKDNLSRTVLSVLSIAVGVIAFGGMLTARNTVIINLDAAYRDSNPSDLTIDLGPFDSQLQRWVATQPGVRDATGMTVITGKIAKADGSEQDVTIYAHADYKAMRLNKLKSVDGAYPPARGDFALERSTVRAAALNFGDSIRLTTNADKVHVLRYSGVIYDVSTPAGPATTVWNLFIDARTLADLDIDTRPTRMLVQSMPGTAVADKYALADRLRDGLGKRGFTVRSLSVNERGEHWAAATVGGIILILVLVGAVALVMSGFLIVNVVNGLLLSQRKIIGIMKIVGGDRWQIFGVYLVMMVSLGFLALLFAMPLSALMGNTLARFISGVINFDITRSGFTPQIAGLEAIVALLVPMLFSAGPIWSALRITPAQAISDVAPRQKATLLDRILARLEQLPRTLALALRSVFRNNTRLIVTMLTLIVAGGVFISILNLREGLPATLTRNLAINSADITITFGAPVGRAGAENRALQVPGVTQAEGWLTVQSTVVRPDGDGSTIVLTGGNANARSVVPPIVGGRWLSTFSPDTRDEIVLSMGVLDSEPGLKLGDTLTLKRNGETRLFRIVGFVTRSGGAGSTTFPGYAHYESVARLSGLNGSATTVRVMTADTSRAATDALVPVLRAQFEDAGFSVVNVQSRAQQLAQVIQAISVIITLLIVVATLIAIVGGLGLAGTMSLNVMERTREIGVMRAVGAETPDLRMMFVVEGLFIGLLSAVISFVLSFPLTSLFGVALASALRFGSISVIYSPTGYLLWPLIVSVVSIVASLSPARRATQISVREALAYA